MTDTAPAVQNTQDHRSRQSTRNHQESQNLLGGHELTQHAQSCVLHYPAVLTVCADQNHPHVFLAQAMFAALRQEFHEFSDAPVTGHMDDLTVQNIRRLQSCAGLPETGDLDKITWNRLCRLYRAMFDRFHTPTQG